MRIPVPGNGGSGSFQGALFMKLQIQYSKIQDSKLRELAGAIGPILGSGCSLRRSHTTARSCGPPLPPGCGPHGLFKAEFHPRPARSRADGPATIRSSPPPGDGCGLLRFHSEPQIHDSKLNAASRVRLGIHSGSGCSLRSARASGPAGRELRASAAGRLRPADVCNVEFATKRPRKGRQTAR